MQDSREKIESEKILWGVSLAILSGNISNQVQKRQTFWSFFSYQNLSCDSKAGPKNSLFSGFPADALKGIM